MRTTRSDLSDATWRKSSHSNPPGGDCVEVADHIPGTVLVRDSKRPHGPALALPATAWAAFVTALNRSADPLTRNHCRGTWSVAHENLSPLR
ncbi:DUF397 domain-containing protein [Streptomyces syringium]|uniref:DUF397 domain-containing protein n=1 Tax=Streptomyces syringium TaxID=76729 RepID=UPI0037D34236